ncbi:MAG TPA: FAD-binding domain [Chthoniobacterales bacterium]|nr:FAD-binding domain [Chthoniobacterales bacterium]
MSRLTILISGAGIAGSTLAYWLRRCGFEPVIVERAPEFRSGGYMIDFWGLGFEVADRMGLVRRLQEVGYQIERIQFVDEKNNLRSELNGDVFRRALGQRFVSLPRGDLARAIFDLVADNTEVIYDDSISALHEAADGVQVNFTRRAPRKFDLVVGCDGLHSAVRTAAFGAEAKFEKYLGYCTASFLTADYPRRNEHAYFSYAAPGRQISRYALRDGRTAFFIVFAQPESPNEKPPDARRLLHKTFRHDRWIELPEILRRLDRCDDLYFDAVSQIGMPSWSRGRCVLVGDAAFCPSLLAGEGASFAMAGAYILAGELQRAGGDYAQAFAAYEKRFRPFIERKQRSAAQFATSFAPRTRFGLFVRDQVLRLASVCRPVANFLMRRFVADTFALPDYAIGGGAPNFENR